MTRPEPRRDPAPGPSPGLAPEPGPAREAGAGAGHGPDAVALERVSRAALSWLRAHLPDFRLPPDPTAPDVDRNVTLKPLGELSQISVSVLRASEEDSAQHRMSRELLDFAWQETGQGELFLTLMRSEPHATYPVEFYGAFTEAGLRRADVEEHARLLATTRAWHAAETEPTRRLSLLNTQRRLGVPPRRDREGDGDPVRATRRTWLGKLPEPWAFERHAGYALTHHVFHVTNWGEVPGNLPAEVCAYLTHWLPAWLDSCVERGHWDLTGELLAVAASLPEPLYVAEAWHALAAAQNGAGALAESGPPPAAPPAAEPPGTFPACYHSTLVAAFAAVLAAERARTPEPATTPPQPAQPPAPAPVAAEPTPGGGSP